MPTVGSHRPGFRRRRKRRRRRPVLSSRTVWDVGQTLGMISSVAATWVLTATLDRTLMYANRGPLGPSPRPCRRRSRGAPADPSSGSRASPKTDVWASLPLAWRRAREGAKIVVRGAVLRPRKAVKLDRRWSFRRSATEVGRAVRKGDAGGGGRGGASPSKLALRCWGRVSAGERVAGCVPLLAASMFLRRRDARQGTRDRRRGGTCQVLIDRRLGTARASFGTLPGHPSGST